MNRASFLSLAFLLLAGGFAQADDGCCGKQACPTGQKITGLLGEWKAVTADQEKACPVEQGKIQATFASVTEGCPVGSKVPETLKFTRSVLTAAVALDAVRPPCDKCKQACKDTDAKCCGSDACKLLSVRSAAARDLHRLVSYAVDNLPGGCSKSQPATTGEGCSKSQPTTTGEGCSKSQPTTTGEGCSKSQPTTTGEGCSKSQPTTTGEGCSKSQTTAATEGCTKGTQFATAGEVCSKGPDCCQLKATTAAAGCSKTQATTAGEGCSKSKATTAESGCSKSQTTAATEGCTKGTQFATVGEVCSKGPDCCQLKATTAAAGCSKTQATTAGEGCSKSKATTAESGCSKSQTTAATEGCTKGTQFATAGEVCSKGPDCCQLKATTAAAGCSKTQATTAGEGCSKSQTTAVATSTKATFCAKTLSAQAVALKASWAKVPSELETMCPNKKKEVLASIGTLQKSSRALALLPETVLATAEGVEALDKLNGMIVEYAEEHPEFAEKACENTRAKFLEQARLIHEAAEVLQEVRAVMKNAGPQEKPSVALGG